MPIKSKGKCRLCNKEFSQQGIKKHLLNCNKDGEEKKVLFLKASAGPFWVYFEIEAEKTLEELDSFLRDLWLECCGHLSAFLINDKEYATDGGPQSRAKSMNVKLKDVLTPGSKFSYEYDFGSTTELSMECIKEKSGQKGINIIARNEMPDLRCHFCDNPASFIRVDSMDEELYCDKCSEKNDDEEADFMPVLNSPRTGVCGFTGCRLIDS